MMKANLLLDSDVAQFKQAREITAGKIIRAQVELERTDLRPTQRAYLENDLRILETAHAALEPLAED
jgi:hypothetical protein